MANDKNNEIAELFQPRTIGECLIIEGFGAKLTVEKGHLTIHDGFGPHRRTQKLSRIERRVKRIMWVALDGYVTVDAMRWMNDLGIAFIMVDTVGEVLMMGGSGKSPKESRLVRRQALGSLAAAKYLMREKLRGQYELCLSPHIEKCMVRLQAAESVKEVSNIEAKAAQAYFRGYKATPIHIKGDVPEHWRTFGARQSLTTQGKSTKRASNPINALLNLAYAILYSEARIACHAMGLDPSVGLVHHERQETYAMALDVLEPVRPIVDRMIFDLIRDREFTAKHFTETIKGQCLVMPPLDKEIITRTQDVVRAPLGTVVERVAHILADESRHKVEKPTRLTKENQRKATHASLAATRDLSGGGNAR